MNKITIIIPVYNEKDFLTEIINRVENVDFGLEKEIILVDDYSTDGTRELYKKIPHKVLYHDKNMGKGASLRDGIKEAAGDIIVFQDADFEYNPNDYVPLVELIKKGEADVVYGSRLRDKYSRKNFIFLSYLANKFLTMLTRILYGVPLTDMETCYKAFRADIVKQIDIKSNRFDVEPEITAKVFRQNIRFRELPISYQARAMSEGKKIGWKDGFQAIFTILKYKFFD